VAQSYFKFCHKAAETLICFFEFGVVALQFLKFSHKVSKAQGKF